MTAAGAERARGLLVTLSRGRECGGEQLSCDSAEFRPRPFLTAFIHTGASMPHLWVPTRSGRHTSHPRPPHRHMQSHARPPAHRTPRCHRGRLRGRRPCEVPSCVVRAVARCFAVNAEAPSALFPSIIAPLFRPVADRSVYLVVNAIPPKEGTTPGESGCQLLSKCSKC